MSKHLTEGRISKGGQNDPADMGERPPEPKGSGGKPAIMTPVGSELDAAVLRAIGWEYVNYVKKIWRTPTNEFVHVSSFSNITNGHEALRLCGPWLDEHCGQWSIESHTTRGNCRKWFFADANLIDSAKYIALDSMATRAEAIARLVLAIAEREGT